MININELRIGNSIIQESEIIEVDITVLNEIKGNENKYFGILINKDILTKIEMSTQPTLDKQYWFEPDGKWLVEVVENSKTQNNYIAQCHFVHQLQNIIFFLTGEEIMWKTVDSVKTNQLTT